MTATVLLVDNDADFGPIVSPVLAARGYRVLGARSGAEATATLLREKPDVLVVSGLLPDTTGIKWIAGLQGGVTLPPIVFVSSFWRDLRSAPQLRALGVAQLVYKPVDMGAFLDGLATLLASRAASKERETPPPTAPTPPPRGDATPVSDEDADLEAQFAARYAALSAEYGLSLPAKVDDMVTALRTQPLTKEALEKARGLAHQIRGTAGSCGFVTAGEAAGRIEDALGRVKDPAALAGSPSAPLVDAAVELLVEAARAAAEESAGQSPGPETTTHGQRVLCVSADTTVTSAVAIAARRHLVEVVEAHNVEEALDRARGTPPDVAILDAELPPSESAFALAHALRALPGCEALPLAFVADAGELSRRVLASHAGASVFLTKPVEPGALEVSLQQLLALREQEQPHVLVVDDDEFFRRRLAQVLQRHKMRVTQVSEPGAVLDALEQSHPDVVLLDAMLPGVSGFDICKMLRTMPRWRELPVLFLTAKVGLESRMAAFQSGADDYLAKPIVDEELLARIRVRLERTRLLQERADKDALTGLLTRRALLEGLRARLSEAARHNRPLAVCLLDLDRFKHINDTFGHMVGDQVLAGLGKLLLRRFRREDLRGRWGGEEFVVAFPGEAAQTVEAVLTRVLSEFREQPFTASDGATFVATFSGGVASFPVDGDAIEDLLRVADTRLYLAKHQGRNRVVGAEGAAAAAASGIVAPVPAAAH